MRYIPAPGRVLVKPVPEEKVTEGGILLPETTTKDKPNRGTVIEVGHRVKDDPKLRRPPKRLGQIGHEGYFVERGDTVLYSRWAGSDVNLDGEHHVVLVMDDILLREQS